MTYYYCPECNEVFPEDKAKTTKVEWGYGFKEVLVCPCCRNDCIEEADYCRICGEPIASDEEYCAECAWELKKLWERTVCECMDRCEDGCDYLEAERRLIDFLQDGLGVI